MANRSQDWQKLSVELGKREREALEVYRPSILQEPFHKSKAQERIVRGGKRAGKSIATAMEFASMVTGRPIILRNGRKLKPKCAAATPDSPRQYWIIGWDTSHAATIHRLLFQRGMGGTLRVIQDDKTGKWRTFNWAEKQDMQRFDDSKLSEPIIPPRLIIEDTWAWESKKDYKFQSVQLTNGAMIYYWPSSAKSPKQGEAVSGLWIDEDIQYANHLKEWQDRLTDMKGWFLWSVWPHVANDALLRLLDRAELDSVNRKPQIETFQLIMSQNPHLDEVGKQESLNRMETEDEIARRDRGELMMDHLLMYDFYPALHVIDRVTEVDQPETAIQHLQEMYRRTGMFPREWTRYLSIDPSHTRTACHGWVVPPPFEVNGIYYGNIAICEWEVVARKYSAHQLVERLYGLMSGLNYEAFIMDQNAGRQTHAGRKSGETTFHVYGQAFQKKRLLSRLTHASFIPGVNVPSTRHSAVRRGLTIQEHGIPMFLFAADKTWETRKEFGSYRKKTMQAGGEMLILDEPAEPRKHDCMQSFEYFAAYIVPQFEAGSAYVEPSVYGGRKSPALRHAREIMSRQRNRNPDYVHLGPGAAA